MLETITCPVLFIAYDKEENPGCFKFVIFEDDQVGYSLISANVNTESLEKLHWGQTLIAKFKNIDGVFILEKIKEVTP